MVTLSLPGRRVLVHFKRYQTKETLMHLMHLIWVAGQLIGFFHGPAVLVTTVMVVFGVAIILVFFKVFEKDLFNSDDD